MYVCVCIDCMCMYRLYMSVLYELILYWPLLQRQAQESQQRPQMTFSCGGTRRASLRASQVMGANTFSLHSCNLRQPDFAHSPLLPRRRSLNRPPRMAWWRTRPDLSLSTLSQAPSQAIGEVLLLPATYSVCHSPPKTPPDRDWRMHVCACICMYVYV